MLWVILRGTFSNLWLSSFETLSFVTSFIMIPSMVVLFFNSGAGVSFFFIPFLIDFFFYDFFEYASRDEHDQKVSYINFLHK